MIPMSRFPFSSCAMISSSLEKRRTSAFSTKVIDEFVCRGAIFFVALRHPDAMDLEKAADFAKGIINMRV
ncbi:MAG: hypothetical protein WC886_03455, partial [Saccharofermentanaceae bacterium]